MRSLFDAAVARASAERAMPPALPVAPGGRLAVIAAGKAAAAMTRAAVTRTELPLTGLVVVPYGHRGDGPLPPGVEVIEAGHPVPDANGVYAAERALALAAALTPRDRLLVLLSGGGSALLAAPAPGVSLADKQAVTRALLHSGAGIGEVNRVRKHLSRIKGGRLAAATRAVVSTWLISDVPGDDPAAVASGPSLPDTGTLADARAIVARYGLALPPGVTAALANPANETPVVAPGETRIVARARDALDAAAALAGTRGFRVEDDGDAVTGEARLVGAAHARRALTGSRRVMLSGGELGVTVRHPAGRGGRNCAYALALAIGLAGAPDVWALAADSDGIDGAAEAAGAIVTPTTLARAAALGLDPARHLAADDAGAFFAALGDLVVTGPTLTNVNDIRAILIDRA